MTLGFDRSFTDSLIIFAGGHHRWQKHGFIIIRHGVCSWSSWYSAAWHLHPQWWKPSPKCGFASSTICLALFSSTASPQTTICTRRCSYPVSSSTSISAWTFGEPPISGASSTTGKNGNTSMSGKVLGSLGVGSCGVISACGWWKVMASIVRRKASVWFPNWSILGRLTSFVWKTYHLRVPSEQIKVQQAKDSGMFIRSMLMLAWIIFWFEAVTSYFFGRSSCLYQEGMLHRITEIRVREIKSLWLFYVIIHCVKCECSEGSSSSFRKMLLTNVFTGKWLQLHGTLFWSSWWWIPFKILSLVSLMKKYM